MRDGGESETVAAAAPGMDTARLEGVLLTRLAVAPNGATPSTVEKDVRALLGALAPDLFRALAAKALERLVADGLVVVEGRRAHSTTAGLEAIRRLLACKKRLPRSWVEARDVHLVARALGLERAPIAAKRALRRVEGLRAAILVQRHALPARGTTSAARLRAALAEKVAGAERGRRAPKKAHPSPRRTPSPLEQRLVAARLARRVCSVESDARLIGDLAADAVGASSGGLEDLRKALLANFILPQSGQSGSRVTAAPVPCARRGPERGKTATTGPAPGSRAGTNAATDATSPAGGVAGGPRALLDTVAHLVDLHARAVATGWHGDRKAFISHVRQSIRAADPRAALTEDDFKRLLVQAHAAGKLHLTFADLKDGETDAEVRASAVISRNAVWHYVRVLG
jgi:hypothetical protein